MTGRAACQLGRCSNLAFCSKSFTQFLLIGPRSPIHGENFVHRPEIGLGVPVAVDTPLHQQRICLEHQRHLVDLSMTRGAAHAFVHMNAVIEVSEIGQAVDFHPLNGFVRAIAFADRLEIIRGVEKHGVTIHAGFCRWDTGNCRGLHAGMAVAAIYSVVPYVMLVAELHRLLAGDVLARHVRGTRYRKHRQKSKPD